MCPLVSLFLTSRSLRTNCSHNYGTNHIEQMKIVSPSSWLLSTAKTYKHYKPIFNVRLSSLNKFAWIGNGQGISNIPFSNPDRQCEMTRLSSELKTPLQIKLPAQNHENHGRVYAGNYPSVTTILDATRPKSNLFALLNWRRKLIDHLGKSGYEEKVAEIRNSGSSFHEAVKQFLTSGNEPQLLETNKGHWKSVSHVLSNIDEVIALESVVVHPELHYAGTLDGLVCYQKKLCVIDWKTSGKKRAVLKDCFSYPHQIVAYAGAVNYDQNYVPFGVSSGLLVLVYSDGSPADTIWMSEETCQYYWNEWLLRLEQFNEASKPTASGTYPTKIQGNKLNDHAQYVGGVPLVSQALCEDVLVESPFCTSEKEIEHGDLGEIEWSETGMSDGGDG